MQTILLVDDEANVIKSITRILQDEPWQVLTAKTGRLALELMATTPVDVILSDERMPGMSGVELLSAVSRMYPETIRIILTGHSNTQIVFQAISEGAIYRFLTKPWNDDELLGIIRTAMVERKQKSCEALLNTKGQIGGGGGIAKGQVDNESGKI